MYNKTAYYRFYDELNDFLKPQKRKTRFSYPFNGITTVKDLIESMGVPHTEVDLILVNSSSVDFNYIVQDGDEVSIYPTFKNFDISQITHLRPKPLRNIKFIVDVNLGKLVKYLRMLGFNTKYSNNYTDHEIVKISMNEKRIILTRDKGVLKYSSVTHGYWVRSTSPQKQIIEVMNYFQLLSQISPFTRCLLCNGTLKTIDKAEIINRITDYTAKHYNNFKICTDCNKTFWKGSHYTNMETHIKRIIKLQ